MIPEVYLSLVRAQRLMEDWTLAPRLTASRSSLKDSSLVSASLVLPGRLPVLDHEALCMLRERELDAEDLPMDSAAKIAHLLLHRLGFLRTGRKLDW